MSPIDNSPSPSLSSLLTNASTAASISASPPTTTHPPKVSPPFSASADDTLLWMSRSHRNFHSVGSCTFVASATGCTPPCSANASACSACSPKSSPNSSSTSPSTIMPEKLSAPNPSTATSHSSETSSRHRLFEAASRPCRHSVAFKSPPTPYAGSIRSERARSAAGPDFASAPILCAAVAFGALTMSSAVKCRGVQKICMSGGETSCETVAAVSRLAPVALVRPAASASGTTNAPPIVKQSRAANSA
mmetsp:Transcript_4431/g.18884  ORF Transcript_4431/g.18884 Transcript_4431/m.18884 type:complete len:248 (-) Transcript_4431:671-1414(-)